MQQTYSQRHEEFNYSTKMVRINLDEECIIDINSGNGHIISVPEGSIKKELRSENGIFSPKFGQTLEDANPFADRYKCKCGLTQGRINNHIKCKSCGAEVKYVGDNPKYTGWIRLSDKYRYIHPNLYKTVEYIIGSKKLINILRCYDEKDIDGHSIEFDVPSDEPYYGIGMVDFRERFDEIIKYYISKNSNKKHYYADIKKNRDKIFTRSIPVYTTQLRPYKVEGDNFHFGNTNELYIMMMNISDRINRDTLKINRRKKPKAQLLFDLQMKVNELYNEIEMILSGKRGNVRMLFGGRYNFTSRNVIVPNPELNVDEVSLSFTTVVELLQPTIINILQKSYNISYDQSYKIWYQASISKEDRVWAIIENIIENGTYITLDDGTIKHHKGIPVLINRNPTISYGGIMQMFCTMITDNYTMGVPLQILSTLNADFDQQVA